MCSFASRLALILLIALCSSGCSWGPILVPNQPLKRPRRLVDLTQDGSVVLESGRRFKLAGLRMRPVEETQEPDALELVKQVVGSEVDLTPVSESNSAMVYYKRRTWGWCGNAFMLPNPLTIFHYVPRYHRASLNALLICIGLAEYDPGGKGLPEKSKKQLRKLQEHYKYIVACQARDRSSHDTSLSRYAERPWKLSTGIRVARGDLKRPVPEDGAGAADKMD